MPKKTGKNQEKLGKGKKDWKGLETTGKWHIKGNGKLDGEETSSSSSSNDAGKGLAALEKAGKDWKRGKKSAKGLG